MLLPGAALSKEIDQLVNPLRAMFPVLCQGTFGGLDTSGGDRGDDLFMLLHGVMQILDDCVGV